MPTPTRKKPRAKAEQTPIPPAAEPEPSQTSPLQIEEWPIDKLIAYARNPRVVKQAAIDKVAASLKEFGWRQPIVVDKENVIVVGHTRLLAARKLGLLTVPVHIARDLTPSQARAYRIADNRTGEETKWAAELLKLEMADLSLEFGNLDVVTGFNVSQITQLLVPADEAVAAEKEGPSAEEPEMRWGKTTVRITAEEALLLDQVYEQYVTANGISYGFIRDMVAKAFPNLIAEEEATDGAAD